MLEKFKGLLVEEEGQGMVEYGLIIALVSIAAIAALLLIGPELVEIFEDVVNALRGVESGTEL